MVQVEKQGTRRGIELAERTALGERCVGELEAERIAPHNRATRSFRTSHRRRVVRRDIRFGSAAFAFAAFTRGSRPILTLYGQRGKRLVGLLPNDSARLRSVVADADGATLERFEDILEQVLEALVLQKTFDVLRTLQRNLLKPLSLLLLFGFLDVLLADRLEPFVGGSRNIKERFVLLEILAIRMKRCLLGEDFAFEDAGGERSEHVLVENLARRAHEVRHGETIVVIEFAHVNLPDQALLGIPRKKQAEHHLAGLLGLHRVFSELAPSEARCRTTGTIERAVFVRDEHADDDLVAMHDRIETRDNAVKHRLRALDLADDAVLRVFHDGHARLPINRRDTLREGALARSVPKKEIVADVRRHLHLGHFLDRVAAEVPLAVGRIATRPRNEAERLALAQRRHEADAKASELPCFLLRFADGRKSFFELLFGNAITIVLDGQMTGLLVDGDRNVGRARVDTILDLFHHHLEEGRVCGCDLMQATPNMDTNIAHWRKFPVAVAVATAVADRRQELEAPTQKRGDSRQESDDELLRRRAHEVLRALSE